MPKRALGIDLGTSNCCVAVLEGGKPRIFPDERGNPYTPSYLTILPNRKYLVGHLAKVQVISNPFQTAYAVKRLMGRHADEPRVQEMAKMVGYSIVAGKDNFASIQLGEQVLTPVDISAAYLQCMRDIANYNLETDEIKDVIITVPAYFNDAQRKATKSAGERAGFNVLRLINEPTAAALAYGFRKNMDKRVAIFDLGGGTFDISVLDINGGIFEVVATHGDSFLGGYDFDSRLVHLVLEQFKSQHGIDLTGDKMALQRVKDACENAKCELSGKEKAEINLPFIAQGPTGSINLAFEITRETFLNLTQDLIDRTITICKKALADCKMKPQEISEVILVGGQTRMPAVQKAVEEFFGRQPVKGIHPDEAVALGAAIEAGMLEEKSKEVLLLDVTPLTLGIQSTGDMFSSIVTKNTKIPNSVSRIFTTTQDDQEKVKIMVLQGEEKKASENVFLGEFTLEGIRPAPRMEPKIQVTFRIDTNGILNVRAKDLETNQTQQISIRNYIDKEGQPVTEAVEVVAGESLDVVPRE